MEPDLAYSHGPRSADWERVHSTDRERVQDGAKTPRFHTADGLAGRMVRYRHPGIVRNALPVRGRLHFRFIEIHEEFPFSAHGLRGRHSPNRPSLQVVVAGPLRHAL